MMPSKIEAPMWDHYRTTSVSAESQICHDRQWLRGSKAKTCGQQTQGEKRASTNEHSTDISKLPQSVLEKQQQDCLGPTLLFLLSPIFDQSSRSETESCRHIMQTIRDYASVSPLRRGKSPTRTRKHGSLKGQKTWLEQMATRRIW